MVRWRSWVLDDTDLLVFMVVVPVTDDTWFDAFILLPDRDFESPIISDGRLEILSDPPVLDALDLVDDEALTRIRVSSS